MSRVLRNLVLLLVVSACAGGGTENGEAQAKGPEKSSGAASAASAGSCDPVPAVVAKINGREITAAELEKEASSEIIEARLKLFEARQQGLEQMIWLELLDAEAKKRGVSREALLKTEIEDKTPPP